MNEEDPGSEFSTNNRICRDTFNRLKSFGFVNFLYFFPLIN